MGKGLVRSLLAKYLPGFGFDPPQPDDLQAAYIPVWFIDGEVTGTISKSGNEMPLVVHSLNSYMPGFSFDPLSTLSFSQPGLEDIAVPFTPDLRNQHGLEVSCPPYTISPVPLPEIAKLLTPSQSKLTDSVVFNGRSVKFSMLAAYPVLLPVYLMRYDWKVPTTPASLPLTCIVQAHSENGLAYFNIGAKEGGRLLRKTLSLNPGSLLHKFTHAADDMPSWDATCGTDYGFSCIGVPNVLPYIGSLNGPISEWLDTKIQSPSNMAALAECGVDMGHPCVRMFNKEEVDANRKYLVASGAYHTMQETLRNVSVEKIRSGEVKVKVIGKRNDNPETVYESLKERIAPLEEQKDELKPQWLRDWHHSRGQGQSVSR